MNDDYSQLKEDIKCFVENKIQYANAVNEIFQLFDFKIDKPVNDINLFGKLLRFKKILQLMLNLYNNYDLFKDCTANFSENDNNISFSDIFLLHDDNDEGKMWRSNHRPDKRNIEKALYNYVLCYLSIKMKENNVNGTYMDEKKFTNFIKCEYCEEEIQLGEEKCSICDANINEMVFNVMKVIDENKKIENKKLWESTEGKNSENKKYLNKWKCGVCQYANSIILMNCESCGGLYKDGQWICERCTFENSCVSNECSECGGINGNMKMMNKSSDEKYDNGNYINGSKTIKTEVIIDKWKCGRCECLNEYTFVNCKVCEGLYKDGKWNCGKCTMENSCVNNICSECREENYYIKTKDKTNEERNEFIKNENDIKEFMIKNKEIEGKTTYNKWKCGKCECLNDYIFDHCKACGGLFKDGKWNCGKCTMRNDCVNDKCGTCEVKNVNVEIKNKLNDGELLLLKYQSDKGNEVELDNNQWRCGRCAGFQLYNFTVCNVCNGSRIENGLWKCSQCSLVNKCGFVKCTVCGVMNYQLLIKYCEYCKKNIVNINEARCGECARNQCNLWQCGNINCRVFNTMNFVYCYHCNLWRYNSYIRGELVRLWYFNRVISVFLCQKCYKFDNEASQVCSYCGETRYEKRFCMDCNVLNDGKTLHCNKCNRKLC